MSVPYDPRFRSGVVNVFVLLLCVTLFHDLWRFYEGSSGYIGGIPVTVFLLVVVFVASEKKLLYGDTERTVEYVAGIALLGLGLWVTAVENGPRPVGSLLIVLGTTVHPTTRDEILNELRNWELRFHEARRSVA